MIYNDTSIIYNRWPAPSIGSSHVTPSGSAGHRPSSSCGRLMRRHPSWRSNASRTNEMKKTERLDEATTPDGTVLTLFRHDREYTIRVSGVELMSTRQHHSEDKLAELVCTPLRETPGARVLIGGLGFGFTLKAALAALGPDAHVMVVELMAPVIAWNRNPDYELAGAALADERVDLRHDDVANV